MLDLKLLQRSPEVVAKALADRGSSLDMAEFTALDERRRALLAEVEALKGERNKASGEVARMKRAGEDAAPLLERLSGLSDRIKDRDRETEEVKAAVNDWLLAVPNIPDASVPFGRSEADNPEVLRWGTPRAFTFTPKEHWEIGTALGGLDFERAGKLAGSRFAVYRTWAARMERALANFFLDTHITEHGYTEIIPPFMANRKTLTGTGNLPKFEEDLFKLEGWDYFLIPTAEVPLTNLHADEMLEEAQLPISYAAMTPCFRSEAGSYGKDTRGLIRQHQFTKVEMVRFAHPERSFDELEKMRGHAEVLLQRLGLPYRVITLCTGDMGFSSTKTYDIEVWLPGQNAYREISSCSNCGDFQARRAGIRFRPAGGGKPEFAHTLNGSGLAVGRALVAVIENYQQEDGSVVIPEVLRPYMGGMERVTAE
ncbi:serine--tRNA ligase [Desulfovibrio oxamicus]|uniref:Serine--tRNA ligase n=1 Tax=Nitratidesulfovibrio oxamicus TaxID=32016 RepID=A0ABS0IZY3_9BACT|nr:serine--tRNA ligase [Nitratidesulfovibrio oxamicus]MBG3875737.1 serine--tRNA ligase [Nitratidesulfovibrio oxamicus]